MKVIEIVLLILMVSSCVSTSSPDSVDKFREIFGKVNADNLDEIVKLSEKLLMNAYNVDTPKSAYKSFLLDLEKTDIQELELDINKTEIQKFVEYFEAKNIKHDIWSFDNLDGVEVFGMNPNGKFLLAYGEVQNLDSVAKNFFIMHQFGGGLHYSIIANGILEKETDLENYFAKRMIIVCFFYRYATLKLL